MSAGPVGRPEARVTGWHAALVWLVAASGIVATGLAILRFRLNDLDRLVSRTIAYGVVISPTRVGTWLRAGGR